MPRDTDYKVKRLFDDVREPDFTGEVEQRVAEWLIDEQVLQLVAAPGYERWSIYDLEYGPDLYGSYGLAEGPVCYVEDEDLSPSLQQSFKAEVPLDEVRNVFNELQVVA